MRFSFVNDPFIEAIAKRARSVLARHPTPGIDAVAEVLSLPADTLRHFSEGRDPVIDTSFLIDLVAALVQECALDPKWLLTGEYDGELHRRALLLGEDRSMRGARAIRALVYGEYQRLRHTNSFFGESSAHAGGRVKP